MPKSFDECQSKGGRIRTVSGPNKTHGLGKGEYVHFCFLNGKSYRGDVKTKGKEK